MSNHCIRWKCSTSQKGNPGRVPSPEPPDLPNVVPDRVQMHIEDTFKTVLPGRNSDSVPNTEIDESGVDYIRGVRHFDDAEDKDKIVQSIVNNVVADAEWYVVESHVCDHDDNISFDVVSVDSVNGAFVVDGDASGELSVGKRFGVYGDDVNDGVFVVDGVVYDSSNDVSTVLVQESVSETDSLGRLGNPGCDGWMLEEEHGNVPADVK